MSSLSYNHWFSLLLGAKIGSFFDKSKLLPLFFFKNLIFLESDALVEGLGAFVALWDEVEADTTNVLLGTEGLGVVDLVALDLEFHQTEVPKAHLVAHL